MWLLINSQNSQNPQNFTPNLKNWQDKLWFIFKFFFLIRIFFRSFFVWLFLWVMTSKIIWKLFGITFLFAYIILIYIMQFEALFDCPVAELLKVDRAWPIDVYSVKWVLPIGDLSRPFLDYFACELELLEGKVVVPIVVDLRIGLEKLEILLDSKQKSPELVNLEKIAVSRLLFSSL